MGCHMLARQSRVDVWSGKCVTDEGERGNSYDNRRAAVDSGQDAITPIIVARTQYAAFW